jgi:hypothetical protein
MRGMGLEARAKTLRYDDGPCHHSLRRTSTAPHRTAPHSSGASESAHAASARRTKRLHTEAALLLPRPGNRRVVHLAAAPAPHRIADGSCTMFRDTYVTSASNARVPRPRALAQIEIEKERWRHAALHPHYRFHHRHRQRRPRGSCE